MKLFWMILSAVAIVVAAVFIWRRDLNTAFVVAALGAIAWFLNYRAQMRDITNRSERDQQASIEVEDDNED
jgi:hypothetical protein